MKVIWYVLATVCRWEDVPHVMGCSGQSFEVVTFVKIIYAGCLCLAHYEHFPDRRSSRRRL